MKTVELKNGQTLLLREAVADDAADLIKYVKIVADETDFLTFQSDEFTKTIEEEKAIVENFRVTDNQIFLLGMIDDQIVGICTVSAKQHKARIRHIGTIGVSVRSDYWGIGVGKSLLKAVIDWAQENKITRKLNLEVMTHNQKAIVLYKKLGFEIEGTMKRSSYQDGEFYNSYYMGLVID